MRQMFVLAVFVAVATGFVSNASAQTPNDVKQLKAELEVLRKQVSNLEKENELLKREIELMKKEARTRPAGPGDSKNASRSKTKATVDDVDYELFECVRKGNKVTFSFSMLCEKEDRLMYGGGAVMYGLFLTASDGKNVKPTAVEGPQRRIQLKKGVTTKFQIIITGVDEAIPELSEVVLHRGFGLPSEDVHFNNIKINPK
jgi:hypothetical protein